MATAWKIGVLSALIGCGCSSQERPDLGVGGRSGSTAGGSGGNVFVAADAGSLMVADAQSAMDGNPHMCTTVAAPVVIADFNRGSAQAFASAPGVPSGQVFAGPLNQDFTNLNWHVTGSITNAVRIGVVWSCPTISPTGSCDLNLPPYAGIRFTIQGDVGPDQAIDMVLGEPEDDTTAGPCGHCPGSACSGPRISIDLSAARDAPQTITVLWPSLGGGSPVQKFSGTALSSLLWYFHAPPAGENVSVDLTIDDIQFVPKDAPSP